MFKSKQNNGIAKARPNGDTPLSITPTPMSYVKPMQDAKKKSDLELANEAANKAVQDAKNRLKSNKSQELESYLMEQAESKKKN
jgi:hypothetical protein